VAGWYPIGYHRAVDAATTLRVARGRAGLSLRALARRAGTSHATLRAYETGAKVPRVDTLARLVRAAGFQLAADLGAGAPEGDATARGRELVEALELAGAFPAEHDAVLRFPRFGAVA
jgi:transcriptional regulator with XRE-family HTH domain